MNVLFISRKNRQAKYFHKLANKLANKSHVHIVGTPGWHSFVKIRNFLKFNPQSIVDNHLSRRSVKYPSLLNKGWFRFLFSNTINLCERYRYASYISLFLLIKPDKIAVWNGLKLPYETIVAAAKALNIPVIYFENGLLPGTCCIDTSGVNAASSISRDPTYYLNYKFTGEQKPINALKPRPPVKHRRKDQQIDLPEKFIFIPMQVPDDTQIIRHSHWINSMEMLYEQVMSALDASGLTDIKAVFKEHPSWPSHFDDLYNSHPNAIFANANSTPELIEKSIGLITINSTVGLEGVLLDKKVIMLGNNCYRIPGLVMSADNPEQLVERLKHLDHWNPAAELRNNFLRFLNEVYCIPQNWSAAGEEHITAAIDRIKGNDEFSLMSSKAST